FHGRTRSCPSKNGHASGRHLPPEEWQTLLPNAHPGYITWGQFQRNQQRLHEHAQAHGADRRQSPAGEGPALLQGLLVCGRCGRRLTVRYHARRAGLSPTYVGQRQGMEHAERICQTIAGTDVDTAIGAVPVEMVTPLTPEVALTVQQELHGRLEEADRLRQQQVQRARYAADLAQRRYLQVDPNNRFVAEALEADWDDKPRGLTEAQEEYERQRQADRAVLDEASRQQILTLATDFPRLWQGPRTPQRE